MKRKNVFFLKRLSFLPSFDLLHLKILGHNLELKGRRKLRYKSLFKEFAFKTPGGSYRLFLRPDLKWETSANTPAVQDSVFAPPTFFSNTSALLKITPPRLTYSIERRFEQTLPQDIMLNSGWIPRESFKPKRFVSADYKSMYRIFFEIYSQLFQQLTLTRFSSSLFRFWSFDDWWHSNNVVWFTNAWTKAGIVRYPYWLTEPFSPTSLFTLLLIITRFSSSLLFLSVPKYTNIVYAPWQNVWSWRKRELTTTTATFNFKYMQSSALAYEHLIVFLTVLWVLYFTVLDLDSVHLFSEKRPYGRFKTSRKSRSRFNAVLKPKAKPAYYASVPLVYRQSFLNLLLYIFVKIAKLYSLVMFCNKSILSNKISGSIVLEQKALISSIRERWARSSLQRFCMPPDYPDPNRFFLSVPLELKYFRLYYSYNNLARPFALFLLVLFFWRLYFVQFLNSGTKLVGSHFRILYTMLKAKYFLFPFFLKFKFFIVNLFTKNLVGLFVTLYLRAFLHFIIQTPLCLRLFLVFRNHKLKFLRFFLNSLFLTAALFFLIHFYLNLTPLLLVSFFFFFFASTYLLGRGSAKFNIFDHFVTSPFRWHFRAFSFLKRLSISSKYFVCLWASYIFIFLLACYSILSGFFYFNFLAYFFNYVRLFSHYFLGGRLRLERSFALKIAAAKIVFFDNLVFNLVAIFSVKSASYFKLSLIFSYIDMSSFNWLLINCTHLLKGKLGWWVRAAPANILSVRWREVFDLNNLLLPFSVAAGGYFIPLRVGMTTLFGNLSFFALEILFLRLAVPYSALVAFIRATPYSRFSDALLVILNDITTNVLFLDNWGRYKRVNRDPYYLVFPYEIRLMSSRNLFKRTLICIFACFLQSFYIMIRICTYTLIAIFFVCFAVFMVKVVGLVGFAVFSWWVSHPVFFILYLVTKIILILYFLRASGR